MIVLKNTKAEIQQQLKNAIAKCHKLEIKPKVKMIEPNRYEVIGNENQYRVTMRIGERGAKIIDCSCRAGEENMPCYHVAAAFGVHAGILTSRAEAMNRKMMQ